MKKNVKKNYKFHHLTFKGDRVFLPSEVSHYLNRSPSYAHNHISKDTYVRSVDYIRLSVEENDKFVEENNLLSSRKYKHNAYQIKTLITIEGFKKIHSVSSDDDFPSFETNDKHLKPLNIEELHEKEWNEQRVITFRDIDEVHGRPLGTAKRNFTQNKKHLLEGEDYYSVTYKEFSTNFVPNPKGGNPNVEIILLTESGYLMLVKSFTDDLAWEVQRKLIKSYFRKSKSEQFALPQTYEEALEHLLLSVKKEKEAQKQIEVLSPKAERYEDLMNAENCLDMKEVANSFKTGRSRMFNYLRKHKIVMTDKPLPYQKYIDKEYFIVIDVEKNGYVHPKMLVTPIGIDFIAKLLKENPPNEGFFDRVKALFTKKNPLLPTTDT